MTKHTKNIRLVVYDLETTGLNPDACSLVEIGAVKLDLQGKTVHKFQTLVIPRVAIEAGAQAVHGISADLVQREGLPMREALRAFAEFTGANPIFAHNGHAFDHRILLAELERLHLPKPVGPLLDTLPLFAHYLKPRGSLALGSLVREFQIPLQRHHRALDDTRATGELLRLCLEKGADIDEILALGS
jgi:DNA polymerase-3 subunit alpha (Gram-positive type)